MGIAIAFTSCSKSEIDNDTETKSASNHRYAEFVFNDIWAMVDQEAKLDGGLRGSRSCAVVTSNTAGLPYSLNIDFGTGCTDLGHLRNGQIDASFTGQYLDSLTVVTITLTNYMIDSNRVSGTITLTNMGTNALGNMVINMAVSGGRIDIPDDFHPTHIEWDNDYDIELTAGAATNSDPSDDEFSIGGTASGRGTKGNTFTATIETNLSYKVGCLHMQSGVVSLTPTNLRERIIDYGTGCNTSATVTIKNDTYEITY